MQELKDLVQLAKECGIVALRQAKGLISVK
jgi:hypothetical protein